MNFIQSRDALYTTEDVKHSELLNPVSGQKNIDPSGSVFLIEKYQKAIEQVKSVVLGKDEQIELMFVALLAKGHVLLDDLPGMGKTTMARTMAAVLGLDLQRIQFTSDLMPSDVLGMNVYQHGADGQSPIAHFQHGPVFTNLLLADEINRASPRTQSALLEAMAEQQVTLDGVTYHLPHPFWVIATQNPVDYSGTFPLPDSQMDRFMFRMSLGYPDHVSELNLLLGKSTINKNKMSAILSENDVIASQNLVDKQVVNENLARYVLRLVSATRTSKDIIKGLSPRAGLSIVAAARAMSWLNGRTFVSPEDVQKIFVSSVSHRLLVASASSAAQSKIIAQRILQETPIH